ATGHVGGVKVDDENVLADMIAQLPILALIVLCLKGRSLVADLELGFRLIGAPDACRGEQAGAQCGQDSHSRESHNLSPLLMKSTQPVKGDLLIDSWFVSSSGHGRNLAAPIATVRLGALNDASGGITFPHLDGAGP